MKKSFRIIGLTMLANLIGACAVFKVSPETTGSQYNYNEPTSVAFTKALFIKNIDSGNEEKDEDFDSGLHKIEYEKIAGSCGIIFSNSSSKYELILNIVDSANFNFTTKDYLRSFPYYLWTTLSIASLGIVPTHVHHYVFIRATVKNLSTNRSVDFQETVIYDSWVSIIFAFNGDFKTAPTVLKEAVEPAVSNIFGKIKLNIDKNEM